MRWEISGRRRFIVYAGDVWEVEENDKYNWHLIRHGVSVSMPKTEGESFARFQERLSPLDMELQKT